SRLNDFGKCANVTRQTLPIHTRAQPRKLLGRQRAHRIARSRPVERAFVQPPYAQPHALTIHAHQLDPRACAIAEHVGSTVAHVPSELLNDHAQQTIDPRAKIDRRHRHPPARRTQHVRPRTSATMPSTASPLTRSTAPPGNASSTDAGEGEDAEVLTSIGISADLPNLRCQYIHCAYE